ncbi:MAG: hypothetical protein EZS28_030064, partial [Streblomastix strix]
SNLENFSDEFDHRSNCLVKDEWGMFDPETHSSILVKLVVEGESDEGSEFRGCQDQIVVRKMVKDRSQPTVDDNQIFGEFRRIFELSEAPFQARRDPSEEIEQDQIQYWAIRGMKFSNITEYVSPYRNLLVIFNNNEEQTFSSSNCPITSNPSDIYNSGQLGCNADTVQPRTRKKDDSPSTYNTNRGSAAVTVTKLVNRIIEIAENSNLQLHVFHNPGVSSKIPDQFSRFATSGDYSLFHEVFEEAIRELRTCSSIDLFVSKQNKKFKCFLSITSNSRPVRQDCLSLPWKGSFNTYIFRFL